MGLWIEISKSLVHLPLWKSASAMGLWIEINTGIQSGISSIIPSASAMGLWIEINCCVDGTSTASSQPLRWGCGLKSNGTLLTDAGPHVSLCDGAVD